MREQLKAAYKPSWLACSDYREPTHSIYLGTDGDQHSSAHGIASSQLASDEYILQATAKITLLACYAASFQAWMVRDRHDQPE